MTRLSRRYVPHLLACCVPVLIPVLVHSYGDFRADDCKNPAELFTKFGERGADEAHELAMRTNWNAVQWQEGAVRTLDSRWRCNFAVVRSYDPKRLYHNPEIFFVKGAAPDRRAVEWLANGSDRLPIHRAYYEADESAILVAYLLVYNARPVDNPYLAQLSSFPLQLLAGRRPMTIFFISGRGPRSEFDVMERLGREWLLAAWERYGAACQSRN